MTVGYISGRHGSSICSFTLKPICAIFDLAQDGPCVLCVLCVYIYINILESVLLDSPNSFYCMFLRPFFMSYSIFMALKKTLRPDTAGKNIIFSRTGQFKDFGLFCFNNFFQTSGKKNTHLSVYFTLSRFVR